MLNIFNIGKYSQDLKLEKNTPPFLRVTMWKNQGTMRRPSEDAIANIKMAFKRSQVQNKQVFSYKSIS